MSRKLVELGFACFSFLFLITAVASQAQAGPSRNPGAASDGPYLFRYMEAAPGAGTGMLYCNRHVYRAGDVLQLGLMFPQKLSAFWSGEADCYVLIWPAEGDLIQVKLDPSGWEADRPMNLFTIPLDESTLPEGSYQLALVLTIPGGDPSDLNDWYSGFSSLLSANRLKFTIEADEEDTNNDGEVDLDTDGDGYSDQDLQNTESSGTGSAEEDNGSAI